MKSKKNNRKEITGDDVKHIFKESCIGMNKVLELEQQLLHVHEELNKMIKQLYEKKIERIALKYELEKEDARYADLKVRVDSMKNWIEFDEGTSQYDGNTHSFYIFSTALW